MNVAMGAPPPRSELVYFNTDDGVWIVCTHEGRQHWWYNLGFSASAIDAVEVWQRHLNEAHVSLTFNGGGG